MVDLGPDIYHIESVGFGHGGVVVGAFVDSGDGNDLRVARVTYAGNSRR